MAQPQREGTSDSEGRSWLGEMWNVAADIGGAIAEGFDDDSHPSREASADGHYRHGQAPPQPKYSGWASPPPKTSKPYDLVQPQTGYIGERPGQPPRAQIQGLSPHPQTGYGGGNRSEERYVEPQRGRNQQMASQSSSSNQRASFQERQLQSSGSLKAPSFDRSSSNSASPNSKKDKGWFGGMWGRQSSSKSASPSRAADPNDVMGSPKSARSVPGPLPSVGGSEGSKGKGKGKGRPPKKPEVPFVKSAVSWHTPLGIVPGTFIATEDLCQFEPDARHPKVKELGLGKFQVAIDIADVLNCAAITLPWKEAGAAYMMELHLRRQFGADKPLMSDENPNANISLVLQYSEKEDLYQTTQSVIEYSDYFKQTKGFDPAKKTITSVPVTSPVGVEEMLYNAAASPSNGDAQSPGPPELARGASSMSNFDDGSWAPTINDVPDFDGDTLLTPALAQAISSRLPIGCKIANWQLCYSPPVHGMSLQTMFRNAAGRGPSVLLIRSAANVVFGCFASEAWRISDRYFGTGESFVFSFGTIPDVKEMTVMQMRKRYKHYGWTGNNDFTLYSDAETVAVGGGGLFALTIDANFRNGMSGPCSTYDCPCLCIDQPKIWPPARRNSASSLRKQSSHTDFVIKDIEFWVFEA